MNELLSIFKLDLIKSFGCSFIQINALSLYLDWGSWDSNFFLRFHFFSCCCCCFHFFSLPLTFTFLFFPFFFFNFNSLSFYTLNSISCLNFCFYSFSIFILSFGIKSLQYILLSTSPTWYPQIIFCILY